jgi:hypothetical protein
MSPGFIFELLSTGLLYVNIMYIDVNRHKQVTVNVAKIFF